MNIKKHYYLLFGFLMSITPTLLAQNLSATILDSISKEPIPYVTVLLNNKGVITNEEGKFSFILDGNIQETDSLMISCIGYESVAKPLLAFSSGTILLSPKAIELREVIVSNKNYTADEIMDFVVDNLEKNYKNPLTKKRLFHRRSNFDRWVQSDFKVTKSSIDVLNQKFIDSIISTVPKNDSYYSEIVGDLYGNHDEEVQKLDILKASKLYDKNTAFDYEKIEERFNTILRENVKPGSYFKVKSGLFSQKIDAEDVSEFLKEDIDSTDVAAVNQEIENKKKNREEQQKNYANWKRNSLGSLFSSLPNQKGSNLNFIDKSRKYDYTLEQFTYFGNDAVYLVSFKPSGSADFEGTLYINADDFAIIQIDYSNVKPVKKFNLLGISSNTYLSKGKIIYGKNADDYYDLRYLESERGNRIGVKRPLKIIEKNKIVKGRNKQNELAGKMDFVFINVEKDEMIVFESETINQPIFDGFTENNAITPTYMPKYDPEFWKGYTIIEPNTAIKEFTSTELD